MNSVRISAAAFAMAAGLLLGQGNPVDDKIVDEVRLKLTHDTTVRGGALDVSVKDGVVTLRGKVKQAKQKSKAESLAHKVKGVKSVVNEITVEPT
jgi:osmotically-inducible protein OsmY